MQFQLTSPFPTRRRSAPGHRALARGLQSGQQALPGPDGRHRLGQDLHDGQRHPGGAAADVSSSPTTRPSPPNSTASSRSSFPHNAVHYFVSYYDYYQPEAYIPQRDIYIEKDASINQEIDRLRLASTSALVTRRDVIIVASVSCIYGLGSPEDYKAMMVGLHNGATSRSRRRASPAGRCPIRAQRHRVCPRQVPRPRRLRRSLAQLRRVRLPRRVLGRRSRAALDHQPHQRRNHRPRGPALHLPCQTLRPPRNSHRRRRRRRSRKSSPNGSSSSRARENCSKPSGSTPAPASISKCFRKSATARASRTTAAPSPAARRAACPTRSTASSPRTFCCSSMSRTPPCRKSAACSHGDCSRKSTLVEHGFRLPSALDNRPLKFDEWEGKINQVVYVSATPGPYELEKTGGRDRRASDPPDRSVGPADRRAARPRPGAAPLGADQGTPRRRRARFGDHAHQAAGRRPLVLSHRQRRQVQVAP